MGKAMAVEGSTTKAVFEAYIEEFLASSLWPGQVVILDNLGSYKSERVKELIEARGAPRLPTRLLAGLQSHRGSLLEDQGLLLKKAAARTREALVEAIAAALRTITSEDARGWFGNCGYEFEAQDL
jgi:DDE superfamily endonuclease